MANEPIRVEIDSSDLQRAIARAQKYLSDLTPFYEDVGAYMERVTENRFRTETGPDGQPWKELAASTRAAKANDKILTERGKMRESLSSEADPDGVTVGFSDRKARWHQFGTKPYTIEPKNGRWLAFQGASGMRFARQVEHPGVPARPMLGISPANEREILAIAGDQIEREFGSRRR